MLNQWIMSGIKIQTALGLGLCVTVTITLTHQTAELRVKPEMKYVTRNHTHRRTAAKPAA